MQPKWIVVACGVALVSAVGPRVEAQTSARAAQKRFDEAMALMDAGRFPEACEKLDKLVRDAPSMDAEFQLAECFAKVGKVASAWSHYAAVAEEARRGKHKAREGFARRRAEALAPRLPKLTIEVPAEVSALRGVEIRRGGEVVQQTLWGTSVALDPGEHVLSARADQKKPWQRTVRVEEGASLVVQIPALEGVRLEVTGAAEAASASRPDGDVVMGEGPSGGAVTGQRAAAIAVGGAGVAGFVIGAVFGVRALSQWDEALDLCVNENPEECYPGAAARGDRASTAATTSTVMFALGGAGLAAGAILWATGGPSSAREQSAVVVIPAVGPGHVAGMVQVRF